jgi:signal recognition particle receptor subunit beta
MRVVIGHPDVRQVAFVGPFGVGKTTAVRSASHTSVVNTDVVSAVGNIPRPGSPRKRTTTVGLDYGEWHGDDATVAVVGTPGQERFVTVRNSALARATSIVLWLYGDHDYGVDEAQEWVDYLGSAVWPTLTVAVTRLEDNPSAPRLPAYRAALDAAHPGIALVAADPRNRGDVERVLRVALQHRDPVAGIRSA